MVARNTGHLSSRLRGDAAAYDEVVKKVHGAVARDVHQLYNLMDPTRDDDGKVSMLNPKEVARRAKEIRDLETIIWAGKKVGYVKWLAATEKLVPDGTDGSWQSLTPRQRVIVTQMQLISSAIGQLFETGRINGIQVGRGGIMTWDPKAVFTHPDGTTSRGDYRMFKQRQDFVAQRIHGEAFYEILSSANSDMISRVIDAITEANVSVGNDRTKFHNKLDRAFGRYRTTSSDTTINRMSAMEKLRTIKRMPSHIKLPEDFSSTSPYLVTELLVSDPIQWVHRMVHSGAARYAFIVAKASFNPSLQRYENQTMHRKGRPALFTRKLKEERAQYAAVVNNPARLAEYDGHIRGMAGLPKFTTKEHMAAGFFSVPRGYGTVVWQMERFWNSFMNLIRSGLLSGTSWVYDVTEMGQAWGNFGVFNSTKAQLMTLAMHPLSHLPGLRSTPWAIELQDTIDMMRDLGAVGMTNVRWMPSKNRPVAGAVDAAGQVLRVLKTMSSNRSELFVVMAAKQMVDDLRGRQIGGKLVRHPKNYYRNTLRGMGFTDSQVIKLMSGNASTELYNAILRRAANYTVGTHSTVNELPWVAQNPTFNKWINFYRYFQNFAQRNLGDTGRLISAIRERNWDEAHTIAWVGAKKVAGTTVGSLVGKMIILALYGILKGNDDPDKWGETKQRLSDPKLLLDFLARSYLEQALYGPFRDSFTKISDNPQAPIEEQIPAQMLKLSIPASTMTELISIFAPTGLGPKYYGLSPTARATEFLRKTFIGPRILYNTVCAYSLGTDDSLEPTLRSYFRVAQEIKLPKVYAIYENQEADVRKFSLAMKQVTKTIAQKKDPQEVEKAVMDAIGIGTGKSVSQSLKSRKLLDWYNPEDPKSQEMFDKLSRRLTSEQLLKLVEYDALLEEWSNKLKGL